MSGSKNLFVEEELSTPKATHTSQTNDLSSKNDTTLALEQLEQFMNIHPFASEPSSWYAKAIWGSVVTLVFMVGSYTVFAKHLSYWPFKASPAVDPDSLDGPASNPSMKQQPDNIKTAAHDNSHNPSSSGHSSESSAQVYSHSGLFGGHSEIGSDGSTIPLPVFLRGRNDVAKWLEENEDAASAISAISGVSGIPSVPAESSNPFSYDEKDQTDLVGTANTNSANTEVS